MHVNIQKKHDLSVFATHKKCLLSNAVDRSWAHSLTQGKWEKTKTNSKKLKYAAVCFGQFAMSYSESLQIQLQKDCYSNH